MSVIVTANYKGETFEVEIFHDGGIEFPDRDLQYEQAEAEFRPPPSAVVGLYRYWHEASGCPMDVVLLNFEIPKEHKILLISDYVEHVIDLYELEHDGDRMVRDIVDLSRMFVVGNVGLEVVGSARVKAGRFVSKAEEDDSTSDFTADEAVAASAEWLGWAVEASAPDSPHQVVDINKMANLCAARARNAAAAAVVGLSDRDGGEVWGEDFRSKEHELAYKEEAMWQIRRFVDCMEAIGRGEDWPDLGATP